jgi:hypothetical protein
VLLLRVACSPVVGLRPSLVAAAALIVVRRARGMLPVWPAALQVGRFDKTHSYPPAAVLRTGGCALAPADGELVFARAGGVCGWD